MLFAGKWILGLFITEASISAEATTNISSAANGKAAIQIGYEFLTILGFGFPLLYVLYIIRACIQGLGDSFFPMLSSFIQVIMRVSCALFLTKIIGHSGIFWGEICAWIGADIFLLFVFALKIRKSTLNLL